MSKKSNFQTPLGMKDILPQDQGMWQTFVESAERTARSYGFEKIDTPVLEFSDLFRKGSGEETDIAQKEMFSFKTKGGDELTLRPEGTPSVARAYIEHGMEKWIFPIKLFYLGAMFRHEKPQRGRHRQFHQFGVECIGEAEPVRDVQVIQVFFAIFKALKIEDIYLEINTLGCSTCSVAYKKRLREYYQNHVNQLCADCRQRYKTNLMRLLDCKDEKCQRAQGAAPQTLDFLCDACGDHFKKVLDFLDYLEIPYVPNPHLARGLDYYTRTVFEVFQGEIDKRDEPSRLALASGGRYDELIKVLGGKKPTPAVGGALGIERVLDIAKEVSSKYETVTPKVFIVQLGERAKKQSLVLIEEFRRANLRFGEAVGRDSLTSQLRIADKMGVDFVVILGQKEVLDKVVLIREMGTGLQEVVPMDKLIPEIKKRLKK